MDAQVIVNHLPHSILKCSCQDCLTDKRLHPWSIPFDMHVNMHTGTLGIHVAVCRVRMWRLSQNTYLNIPNEMELEGVFSFFFFYIRSMLLLQGMV